MVRRRRTGEGTPIEARSGDIVLDLRTATRIEHDAPPFAIPG
jgi:hypothetical protein